MRELELRIARIAEAYRNDLMQKIQDREVEMNDDDKSHYMLYNILGISNEKGEAIDIYQNTGRFLYKYAGAFAEDATIECFRYKYHNAESNVTIRNTVSTNPKTVEIDCLIPPYAIEIKWRDATTDGDHIRKEHVRVQSIKDAGFIPVRVMLFRPNREQARRIQQRLQGIYNELDGHFYAGDDAWKFIEENTGVNLKQILERLAYKQEVM